MTDKSTWVVTALGGACLIVLALLGSWVANARPKSPALLVYGDSIVVASGTARPWPSIIGATVDARSGRTLAGDPSAAMRISALKPHAVWLAIGTNDYGKSAVTPAQFGQLYAALLDDIHAASPRTVISAQTPIVRRAEAANRLGYALADYRDAITAECALREWVTCIDGRRILTTADLPDGLHPGSEAQPAYAEFVRVWAERY